MAQVLSTAYSGDASSGPITSYYAFENNGIWYPITMPVSGNWQFVGSVNGIYVAHATSPGRVATSTDFVNWTIVPGGNIPAPMSVGVGNGVIIVCSNDRYQTSTDGVTWTSTVFFPSTLGSGFISVIYASGIWYAFGSSATYYSTDNGVTWTSANASAGVAFSSGGSLPQMRYNGTYFYGVNTSSGKIWRWSLGATSWTDATPAGYTAGAAITHLPSGAVIATNGTTTAQLSTNSLMTTWNAVTLPVAVTGGFGSLRPDARFGSMLVTSSGKVLQSTNGTTWTVGDVPAAYGGTPANSVTLPQNRLYTPTTAVSTSTTTFGVIKLILVAINAAVSASNSVVSKLAMPVYSYLSTADVSKSAIGKIWTKPWSIVYAAAKWVGVKFNSASASTSTDGATWTARTLPSSQKWDAIAHNGTVFAAIASNSNVAASSADGVTWTARSLPTSRLWTDMVAGGGKFVAVAAMSDKCAVSADGITWDEYTMPFQNWTAIAHNGTVFCAVSGTDRCAVSTDGITWSEYTMPYSLNYTAISWALGQFTAVASGPTNRAARSTDGITWTGFDMPASANWIGVGPGVGTPNA